MPPRKAGLWELKMSMEGRSMPMQTFQHCIDAATDKAMNDVGGGMRAEQCSKQDMQRAGNTITVNSVCNIGGATTTSRAVVTGDFNSAYTVKVTSKREGGPAIPGMPAETNMTIEAKWTRRLQGRSEAGRHDHGQRHEDEHQRHEGWRAGRGEEVARSHAAPSPRQRERVPERSEGG